MVDELGETKAVYAIIKMKDPNSGLPKMMQINWLPDGLPAAVKAVVSRHVTDVERFFPGVHVRLNARYEEDIEEKVLLAKISKASGANYGVHKEKKKDYGPIAKTGTNYVKTDATKEVDVGQRNEYHRKTQVGWLENTAGVCVGSCSAFLCVQTIFCFHWMTLSEWAGNVGFVHLTCQSGMHCGS